MQIAACRDSEKRILHFCRKDLVPDKPGSVYAIIYLGGRLPCRSSSLPAAIAGPASCILGLAPGGVYLALSITVQTVVSYTAVSPLPEGGLFSVALSVALPLLAVNQHHVLWSPDFPPCGDCFGNQRYSKSLRSLRPYP